MNHFTNSKTAVINDHVDADQSLKKVAENMNETVLWWIERLIEFHVEKFGSKILLNNLCNASFINFLNIYIDDLANNRNPENHIVDTLCEVSKTFCIHYIECLNLWGSLVVKMLLNFDLSNDVNDDSIDNILPFVTIELKKTFAKLNLNDNCFEQLKILVHTQIDEPQIKLYIAEFEIENNGAKNNENNNKSNDSDSDSDNETKNYEKCVKYVKELHSFHQNN